MLDARAESLADEMSRLYAMDTGPFPYHDLRELRRITKKNWTALNPELNSYRYTIAGCCSWGRRALAWPPERVQQVMSILRLSFFEQFPRYLPLRKLITPRLTPSLHADFVLYERMRETTLELACLLGQAETTDTLMKVA